MFGNFSCKIETAFATFFEVSVLPEKFSKDNMAILGSTAKVFTVISAMRAIFTKSSAVGFWLIEVSVKKIGFFSVMIIIMEEILSTPFSFSTIFKIGLIVEA